MTNILILTIDLTAVKCTTYDYHISFLETFKQFYVYPSGLVSIHSFMIYLVKQVKNYSRN